MKPEQHTLTLRSRSTPTTYSTNHDGSCSCGNWIVRNRLKDEIRREHWDHVEHALAPKEPTS